MGGLEELSGYFWQAEEFLVLSVRVCLLCSGDRPLPQ